MKIKLFIISVFICSNLLGQDKKTFLSRHVDVYAAGDSIKRSLIKSGIDTIILYYKTRPHHRIKNSDQTDELHSCFILWIKESKLYYQRLNDYTFYEPKMDFVKNSSFSYLFKYYFLNRLEIESENIISKPDFGTNQEASINLKKYSKEEDELTILDYKIGKNNKLEYWWDLRPGYSDDRSSYDDLNKRICSWATFIEKEFRNILTLSWAPRNLEPMPNEELDSFLGGFLNEIKKQQAGIDEYNKLHTFEKQEFLIPNNFTGLISIVQNQPCGQSLKIENDTRTIEIPSSGVLILNKIYIDYYQEFFIKEALEKTSFYLIKNNSRKKLDVLDHDSKNLESFGLYLFGTIDAKIHNKDYSVLLFFIGTYNQFKKVSNRDSYVETALSESLVNCE